ncbi:MAG TPA: RsmB/NOP family class I SAM-dependent RNA methyltransferase [archaeon]|nr:RsmB/NOP family class I SAM-dependent RNA methyltransferase [archaeon]
MATFIPKEFEEKYSQLLGSEWDEFLRCCKTKIPKSIWINSLKAKPQIIANDLSKKGWELSGLFHENAYFLQGVQRPGRSEEFAQGLFNLQEKASMIPALALAPQKNDLILDAAAAPGNKTLQLSCLMNGSGKIIALEKNVERFKSLRHNIKKFGMENVIAKRMDLLDSQKKELFDKILLDAPCSSEGLVRKDEGALKNWNEELVQKKSELQKKLIAKSFELLKRNGVMVYSTCSFGPEENEEVVQSVLETGRAQLERIEIPKFKIRQGLVQYGNKKFDDSIELCARIYPQDNDTQQFFVAKIRKK